MNTQSPPSFPSLLRNEGEVIFNQGVIPPLCEAERGWGEFKGL